MKPKFLLFIGLLFLFFFIQSAVAQTSTIHFVKDIDTPVFKTIRTKNGFGRTFLLADVDISERIDSIKTPAYSSGQALLCMEGEYKNGLRENKFYAYLIDSADHSKRYKVWEQTFSKNKLNGEWRIYSIKGLLVSVTNFKDGSVDGISRRYRIDGIRVLEEREHLNGSSNFILRKYDDSSRLYQEMIFKEGKANGVAKLLYKNGALKEEVTLSDGKMTGIRKFYHANGQLWSEVEYKNGMPWIVLSNYKANGSPCDAGTLRKGNGTIIVYNEDGTIKEVRSYNEGKIDKGGLSE